MNEIFSLLSAGAKSKKKSSSLAAQAFANEEPIKSGAKKRIDIFEALETIDQEEIPSTKSNLGKRPSSASDLSDEENDPDVGNDENDSDYSSKEDDVKYSDFHREDEVNAFRNRLQIRVSGTDVPHPAATFRSMNITDDLKPIILKNVEESYWKEPTPIQMQAIPALLNGRDILASAPTGSGKTAAFVIPVLSKLGGPKKSGIRGLLLAPTKELAEQIHREATRLCAGRRIKICLLTKKITQATASGQGSVLAGVDLLVATPLRLLALIRAETIDLSKVEIVVLDEADKLFELEGNKKREHQDEVDEDDDDAEENVSSSSFLRQVDEILSKCTCSTLQRGLFSATIGPFVKELAASFLNNPVTLSVGVENAGANTIDQRLIFVGREDGKLLAIRQLIQEGLRPPVLIFLQSKDRAKDLFRELVFDGLNVDVMHAERTQQQREEIIKRFRRGDIWVLICTDLMARGVDFKGVQMVINYDLPQSAVSYIHRIGRTGRAGRRGTAVTLFTEEDMSRLRPIANVVKLSGCHVPDWMLSLKQMSTKDRKRLRLAAPKRREISTALPSHKGKGHGGKDHKVQQKDKQKQKPPSAGGGGSRDADKSANSSGAVKKNKDKNKHKRAKLRND